MASQNYQRRDFVQHCDPEIAVCSPFKNLSSTVLEHLRSVSSHALYDTKTKLFTEGQQARGVFVLCTGKARLSVCSGVGREIIMRFAGPGDILGLSAVVSNLPYGVTAEMTARGRADFIPRASLLQMMKDYHEFALVVAEQLSANYYHLHDAVRSLGLGTHLLERLAKLLLVWTSIGDDGSPW